MTRTIQSQSLRRLGLLVALAAAYFVAGKLGLRFAVVNPNATAIWPPTGIALAALLLAGYEVWPAIMVGAFLVHLNSTGSVPTAVAIAAGNTLEGLLGAYLVDRFARGRRAAVSPGTIVSSERLAAARPPQAMNAMFSLLLRFCPGKIAGAPAIAPADISVRPTKSRRVISRAGRALAERFIGLSSSRDVLKGGRIVDVIASCRGFA